MTPSGSATVLGQFGLGSEDDLTGIVLETAHHPIHIVDRPPAVDRQRLVLFEAGSTEMNEACSNLLGAHVQIICENANRVRGLGDLGERSLHVGRADEALYARHEAVE